jgi:uncharacterized delta-60 repeat protein
MFGLVTAALASALVVASQPAAAGTGSGDLDTTYGTDGFEDLGSVSSSTIRGIQAQTQTSPTDRSDLRVYVATRASNGSYTTVVGRLDGNGEVDTTFGTNGEVELSSNNLRASIGVDGSDRIYVASPFSSGPIVRLTPDGSIDTSYGSSGYSSSSGLDGIREIAVTDSGALVAVGSTTRKGTVTWGAVAFKSDGSVDTSFGKRGTWTASFGAGVGARAVAIDGQGRVLIAGDTGTTTQAVVRLTGAGSLDTTFGVAPSATASSFKKGGGKGGGGGGGGSGGGDSGGEVAMDFANEIWIWDIVIGASDDVFVSGTMNLGSPTSPDTEPFVVHYDSNGIVDSGFGQGTGALDGVAYPGRSGEDYGSDLAIADGKLLQSGYVVLRDGSGDLVGTDIVVYRYDLSDGDMDTTFGPNSDGLSEIADDGLAEVGNDLTIDANGDILVVGRSVTVSTDAQKMLIVRYCW